MISNPNILKTFVSVMECGSVVGAARERGYSPAAVSRHIAWLQKRLGVELFVPDGRSIRPTAAAVAFVDRARDIVDELQRFEEFSDQFATTVDPRVARRSTALVVS